MTSTVRRVPPEKQPLKPAIALAIISLLTVLMSVIGAAAVYGFAATGFLDDLAQDQELLGGEGFPIRFVLITLVSMGLIALAAAMKLASAVLGILVVIRGEGKLRIGASLLLATALFGLFFSFSVDGSLLSGTFQDLISLLATLAEVARWCVMVAGIVILALGVSEVRRERARRPRTPRGTGLP
ncbi:hypothetical protein CFK39_07570 [Brachybacterium avium]|uniref:Uncharacterized protein n=1 Tax=Brachybacterium avium TaxID=2017485 RepID=A0A220UC44_9MICO|nr:hypothetical protein [Brachybacterium avium]ASK65719.1 hypothetical protein CFK39_07570 [Brachybacterium avium]